ncbi:neuromedin-U receptor 1 [Elgaria multicarinata webbii]|uniref:neuromedin-U receptor 1 n=1 Tax=Elgaria multicarinata webbii TaxID=159646 RepID=UPI002FCD51FE
MELCIPGDLPSGEVDDAAPSPVRNRCRRPRPVPRRIAAGHEPARVIDGAQPGERDPLSACRLPAPPRASLGGEVPGREPSGLQPAPTHPKGDLMVAWTEPADGLEKARGQIKGSWQLKRLPAVSGPLANFHCLLASWIFAENIGPPVAMYSSANCSNWELKLARLELLEKLASEDLCNGSGQVGRSDFFDAEIFNMTAEQLRIKYLGPRRSSFFIPICTTYLLIFAVGAVGNALTCLVIVRHRFMRTPTNYYLFSLAVSDLLVLLLGMPLEIYEMWSNYPFLLGAGGCCFKTLLFEAVCFASILNVTALSMERYIAVVHPLKAKYVVTKNHAKRVIVTVWLLSVVCSIPNTSLHGIQNLYVPGWGVVPDSSTCTLVKSRLMYNLIIQVTTIVFFFVPMAIISILYLLIGLQLRKEKMLEVLEAKSGSNCDYHNHRLHQKKIRRRQVTNMLFVLVVVFGICWAPFHTDRLVWSFITHWTDSMLHMFQYVHIISGVFFYLSSAANPILYNLMSTRFREMFKEVMCRRRFQKLGSHKHSPSSTRATMRSTVSEHIAGGNGQPLSDMEEYEMDPEGENAEQRKAPFL